MNLIKTVSLYFVIIIHFSCVCTSEKNADPMEDDAAILNKYLEMDRQLQKLVQIGIKQFLPYIMEANEHLNLSPKCSQNIFAIVYGLRNLKLWPLSFIDASGKLSDGLLWGNIQMIGDFDQCLNITVLKRNGQVDFQGKHCTVEFKPLRVSTKGPNVPQPNFLEVTRNTSEIIRWYMTKEHYSDVYTYRYGVCVPSGCNQVDVQQVAEYYSRMIYMNITAAYCQVEGSFPLVTTRTIVIMLFFGFLITIGIIASGLEYYLKERAGTKINRWMKLLLCFSITSNFQKVMDTTSTGEDRLASLHGIRTLTIFHIILIHRFMITGHLNFMRQGLLTEHWSKTFFSQIITNATVTVDIFLFMGGLLNSYLRRQKKKEAGNSVLTQFFALTFFRIWRLYPAYICAILLNYLFVARGPIAPLLERLWTPCDKYWWRNLIFIHNFFPTENMCLRHSWYISVEMQLFTLSFIPVAVLLRDRRKGYIISGIFAVCGIISAIMQAWILKVPANTILLLNEGSKEAYEMFEISHFQPFTHIAPYFIGVMLGDVLATKEKIKIPIVYQIVGWFLASFIYISLLFSALSLGHSYTRLEAALYIGIKPLGVLGVAWMVLCCAYGHGGIINYILTLKVWVPISRLTYFMYLIHVILQYFYIHNQRNPASLHEMIGIWQYVGDVAITGLLSLVLTVLVESPNIALMKMAFEKISKGREKTGDEKKNGSTIVDCSNSTELKNKFDEEVSKF